MEIELIEVKETDKSVLRQLIELYAYDFSEYDQADVNEHGFYGYKYFDHYWTEEARHPFFIKVDEKLAGFVLINDYCYVLKDIGAKSIAEFFVMRKYRRKGVGRAVAFQVFDKFPGKWEVIQHEDNKPSKHFWEELIGEYTTKNFKIEEVETELWKGQALVFDNSK
ncbi:MAG: GNAT family N-acetyltransferase [Chloroflexi bacterium]|nr:GNAT family N-acetyltransferase [Chloroflexota bacterium]